MAGPASLLALAADGRNTQVAQHQTARLGKSALSGDHTGFMTDPAATSTIGGLDGLMAAVRAATGTGAERKIPPVERWNPPDCGDIGMEIRADGSWWHAGTRITRQPLIDLFATVLRKDADGTSWLITPYEKVPVHVQDAAFIGVRVEREGEGGDQTVVLATNLGDVVAIGPQHPLRVVIAPETREPRPYVLVRGRLEALLRRPCFYELVEWGSERNGMLGLWSSGTFFPIDAIA
jgi:uncharacterized protein